MGVSYSGSTAVSKTVSVGSIPTTPAMNIKFQATHVVTEIFKQTKIRISFRVFVLTYFTSLSFLSVSINLLFKFISKSFLSEILPFCRRYLVYVLI